MFCLFFFFPSRSFIVSGLKFRSLIHFEFIFVYVTSLVAQMVKRLSTMRKTWVGKIPWRRKWQSTPVLLPGKSHGQRSLVGYSPWGSKESDTTERLHFHGVRKCSAAAAKSLQSCPTLCDPIDGNTLGTPVPGILQARTLEWVAIVF